jgi:flagellar protein FliS
MAVANPYNRMLENKVMTATKEELTLMLYDGALKFCNQAIIAIEKKEPAKAHSLIIRVEDIIREFQITLNRDYDISAQLDTLYDYIYRRLVDANVQKSIDILTEVRDLIREFRDMWKEAMTLAKESIKG